MTDAIEHASQLPLRDAAYHLWSQRHQLDRSEALPTATPGSPLNLADPKVFQQAVRRAIAGVQFDRDNAHHGPTFHRLKKAHPEANDQDLQQAIRSAVKLDADSIKYFTYNVPDGVNPVDPAIELARQANPGFLEITYRALRHQVAFAMR